MKGKGKGSGSEECPLQFPDVSPLDYAQECPRYAAVAQGDTSLVLEDLEPLQLELETLLVSVCERRRRLAHETQLLASWQEKKLPLVPQSTPGKRSRLSPDGKPTKKFRDGGKVFTGGRPPRKQVGSSSSTLATGSTQDEGPPTARNDAPNRFWASLEPYCAPVTGEDIRALEELIRSREDDGEYQRVPVLGRHYAQRWAQEDLLEEQTQGARASPRWALYWRYAKPGLKFGLCIMKLHLDESPGPNEASLKGSVPVHSREVHSTDNSLYYHGPACTKRD